MSITENLAQPKPEVPHSSCHPALNFKHKCVNDNGESAHDGIFNLLPFLREDSDNVIFRRFRNLYLLYLLALQHQLKHRVEQLQQYGGMIDKEPLLKVLNEVGPLLTKYDEAMSAYERMHKRLSTPQYARKSIEGKAKMYGLLSCLNKEMGPEDDGWSDLVSIEASGDKGVIHRFIDSKDSLAWLLRKRPKKDPANPDLETNAAGKAAKVPTILSRGSERHFYYSERAVRLIEQILLGFLMCSLVIIPIATLSSISNQKIRLFAIILSVIFAWPLSMLLARPSDRANMTMMLTYATVVVVFLSNNDINNDKKS